jgi:hypothetical protein
VSNRRRDVWKPSRTSAQSCCKKYVPRSHGIIIGVHGCRDSDSPRNGKTVHSHKAYSFGVLMLHNCRYKSVEWIYNTSVNSLIDALKAAIFLHFSFAHDDHLEVMPRPVPDSFLPTWCMACTLQLTCCMHDHDTLVLARLTSHGICMRACRKRL